MKPTSNRNLRVTGASHTGAVSGPLAGFTVGVTADRRADEQIKLLSGRGAECVHGPVIKTHPLDSTDSVGAVTAAFIADPPDVVVITTALGLRSWLEAADAVHLGDDLGAALSRVEIRARGAKARGAIVTAGFQATGDEPLARYRDIVTALAGHAASGASIAVQLDGAGATDLCDTLEAAGARVMRIPVYRWSLPGDTAPADRLVRAVAERKVDAVTFTSKPAVENFLELASLSGVGEDVEQAFDGGGVVPFCVGPVCAGAFVESGLAEPAYPERYRLGSLVQLVARHFAGCSHDVELAGTSVRVQGRLAVIDGGAEAWLTERERAILDVLLERPGAVHSKRDLLRRVWDGAESDEHVVEVTVARLRQRLGPAAAGIETVVRRGYRASAL